MHQPLNSRFSADAGIVLGPILFLLAVLAIIGVVLSAGSGGFQTATVSDRIKADIVSQTNLIRSKINECNLMYGTNANFDGYPQDSTGGSPGVLVSSLNCTGDPAGLQNLWTGNRPTALPPPTAAFDTWYYVNTNTTGLSGTATGGRCIYTQLTGNKSAGVVSGLTAAANKFTHATANDGASEVNYDPSSTHQRFVVWISSPPTAGAENGNCKPQ